MNSSAAQGAANGRGMEPPQSTGPHPRLRGQHLVHAWRPPPDPSTTPTDECGEHRLRPEQQRGAHPRAPLAQMPANELFQSPSDQRLPSQMPGTRPSTPADQLASIRAPVVPASPVGRRVAANFGSSPGSAGRTSSFCSPFRGSTWRSFSPPALSPSGAVSSHAAPTRALSQHTSSAATAPARRSPSPMSPFRGSSWRGFSPPPTQRGLASAASSRAPRIAPEGDTYSSIHPPGPTEPDEPNLPAFLASPASFQPLLGHAPDSPVIEPLHAQSAEQPEVAEPTLSPVQPSFADFFPVPYCLVRPDQLVQTESMASPESSGDQSHSCQNQIAPSVELQPLRQSMDHPESAEVRTANDNLLQQNRYSTRRNVKNLQRLSLVDSADASVTSMASDKENAAPVKIRRKRVRKKNASALAPNMTADSPAKKKWVKFCFIPNCVSNSRDNPCTLFFSVTKVPIERTVIFHKLAIATGGQFKGLSLKSGLYACQLHYELGNDLTPESFLKYQVEQDDDNSSRLKLRDGIQPHKILRNQVGDQVVWADTISDVSIIRPQDFGISAGRAIGRRLKLDDSCQDSPATVENPIEDADDWPEALVDEPDIELTAAVGNNRVIEASKLIEDAISRSSHHSGETVSTTESRKVNSDHDYQPSSTPSEDSGQTKRKNSNEERELRRKITFSMMLEDTVTFMGVPQTHVFIIEMLAVKVGGQFSKENVMITLRKIRLNESFKLLGKYFCIGKSTISKIFRQTLPTVAECLSECVFRVSPEVILSNLPVPFRFQYSSVTDIIDGFEIQVQSSGNAEHRAIMYSSYKGGTTLKFLICITPDCFCMYVSRGYGGRIGDSTLTSDCGYLDELTEKNQVMADRGFKGLEGVLDLRGVKLIRPPSVFGGNPLSKDDCQGGKKIAALRIHVERFIGKVRYFLFLAPHATVPISLVPYVELAVLVAVALVNLGHPLIQK